MRAVSSAIDGRRLLRVEHQRDGDVESAFLFFATNPPVEVAAVWTAGESHERLIVKHPDDDDLAEERRITLDVDDDVIATHHIADNDGHVIALQLEMAVSPPVWLVWRGGDFVDAAQRPDPPELSLPR
jgi:hypothetical protein